MIDRVPVDAIAEIIVAMCLEQSSGKETSQGAHVHHLVNPKSTSWSALLPAALAQFPEKNRPKPVSLNEWIAALKGSANSESNEASRKVKLLPFLDGTAAAIDNGSLAVTLDTEKTAESSERLRGLGAISED